jgi:hypothetical protein
LIVNSIKINEILYIMVNQMAKYKGLFTQDEWRRQILPSLVRECREELLRRGALGKKGARVDRNALLACVKEKAKRIKEERLKRLIGGA